MTDSAPSSKVWVVLSIYKACLKTLSVYSSEEKALQGMRDYIIDYLWETADITQKQQETVLQKMSWNQFTDTIGSFSDENVVFLNKKKCFLMYYDDSKEVVWCKEKRIFP